MAKKKTTTKATKKTAARRPAKKAGPDRPSHVRERGRFRALTLANPNYFGNLPDSEFKYVLQVVANTNYESIGCVGFQPQFERLEAVVYVHQPSGYGGGVCTAGTPEYVRFYLSFDGGLTWDDQGMESFTAYDIPAAGGTGRLEYAVSRQVNPPNRFCTFPNVIMARAILSWNNPPPANTPGFRPVWGDVHDTHIQVDPLKFFAFPDFFKLAEIDIPKELVSIVKADQLIAVAEPKALSVAELGKLYKKKVEPHRFALKEIHQLISQPALSSETTGVSLSAILEGLEINIDPGDIIGPIVDPDGNTSYEELDCIGLNPNESELVAVLRIKRSSGYSGGPCTSGSKEYVTFWADFDDNGTFEACLGTAEVTVYDIAAVPDEGLEYAVFLPVDLNPYKERCQNGPVVVRVRAILSWQVPPPCSNPNYVPVWGNREETLVHIYPGASVQPGDFSPFLYTMSGRGVCSIDQGTGWATGDRPFGARVDIAGEIPAAPALTAPDTLKYKVWVRDSPGGSWQELNNDFTVTIHEGTGPTTAISYSLVQQVDPIDGYYTYREYGTPATGAWRRVSAPNRLLARWFTSSAQVGLWEVRIEALDTVTGIPYLAGVTLCADSTTRQNVKLKLDQTPPVAALAITGVQVGGVGPMQPATDCGMLNPGDIIHGTYSGTDTPDNHFRVLTMKVEPPGPAAGAATVPSTRTYYAPDFAPGAGASGSWTLNTAGMAPCGYVVRLEVWDRTIVSGNASGWKDVASVGFCLLAS